MSPLANVNRKEADTVESNALAMDAPREADTVESNALAMDAEHRKRKRILIPNDGIGGYLFFKVFELPLKKYR